MIKSWSFKLSLIIEAQIRHILDHQHSIASQVLHSLIKLFFQVKCFLSWSPRSPWLLKHLTLYWLQPLLILMFSTTLISLLQSSSKLTQMIFPSSLTARQTTFSSLGSSQGQVHCLWLAQHLEHSLPRWCSSIQGPYWILWWDFLSRCLQPCPHLHARGHPLGSRFLHDVSLSHELSDWWSSEAGQNQRQCSTFHVWRQRLRPCSPQGHHHGVTCGYQSHNYKCQDQTFESWSCHAWTGLWHWAF